MPTSPNSITVKALDIVTAALLEINAIAAGESPDAADAAWALQKLQRLIDRYNARRPMIYNVNFSVFTLQTNHQPHTIGQSGDFDCSQRPVQLVGASLIFTGGVERPIVLRDDQWWGDKSLKTLTSTLPTDVYYSPDWPLGNLYFWPIPTQANQVRLEAWSVLAQMPLLTTSFSMPPAYWDAIVYPLAISLCPSFDRQPNALLLELERKAVMAVQINNGGSPRISTTDSGMPNKAGSKNTFNYQTGNF